ncbi:uncharacterized protein RHOBADRAFT_52962 [Rhodotorula graminis WP1]|uniref:protein-histidine N-methyltransferase n=1 Tax=Rhodotorula graminis (strain WP1) TaxID=578459 RepID=A0A194S5Y7_RHOGW|nr:uncharacterized protein RHOBADRAFT_52962 [Rhodotorula graminis WP1]KPV75954.1 hypothetical protein RHOBADRAFT_52962 [Rhodotorula graminis WP1]
MSFSFAFDIDAAQLDDELAISTASLDHLQLADDKHPAASTSAIPHHQVPLDDLLATLPPLLSYTPVTVPLSPLPPTKTPRHATLLRRDLFDARFQILNQDECAPDEPHDPKGKTKDDTFVDEHTDLVKGVYEGGLKTWECSLDLVDLLDQRAFSPDANLDTERVRGKSILEVGCGTAVPSCSLFARLLNEIRLSPTEEGADKPRKTRLHLQDYNKQVLSLITLPNLLLTYAQHLATPARAPEADEEPPADPQPGELDVTPEFLASFEALLERENVELRFSEGDWAGMATALRADDDERYDVVLTSETVYAVESLPALLDLLEAATARGTDDDALCLVACKRIYFGVGGGELEFRRRVEERGAEVEAVWGAGEGRGKSSGVGRTVMRVRWKGE